MKYTWIRGASFSLALQVISGTVTGSEPVRCVMKAAIDGDQPPGDAAAEAVVFAATFVPAAGDDPAQWLFTGTAAQGEALAVGDYVADARIEIDDDVIQTTAVVIEVVERVTEAS